MKKIELICNKILLKSKDDDVNFIDWLHCVKDHEYLVKKYDADQQFKFLRIFKNIILYLTKNIKNLFLNS